MRRAFWWLTTLGGCFLALAPCRADSRPPTPSPKAPVAQVAVAPGDQEVQQLLRRLTELSDFIVKNPQSPEAWRYHLAQGDVLLQLAARARGKEQSDWLRAAVDSHYSAAVVSPDNDPTAQQRLVRLTGQIATAFPGSPLFAHAALQEIQADCLRALGKADSSPAKAQEYRRQRLLRFARDYPRVAEAPKVLVEAGQISEALGKKDDALRCYRYVVENYAGQAAARSARGALGRLGGMDGEVVQLRLPLLYPAGGNGEQSFDLNELRGSLVVVHFWSSADAHAGEDFGALKQLTDRYQYRGLAVVYVNMDGDPVRARAFLADRLTAGTHLFQPGGLAEGAVAERYGIGALPQTLLVGRDGVLLRHSLRVSEVEPLVSSQWSPDRTEARSGSRPSLSTRQAGK
jgi:hypothetical protein